MSYVSIKEPTKKCNAARKLYGKGKKCRVDCSGGSYIFSQSLRVVNLMSLTNITYFCF